MPRPRLTLDSETIPYLKAKYILELPFRTDMYSAVLLSLLQNASVERTRQL